MSIFGAEFNIFRKVVSTYARAGKPFKSFWPQVRDIPGRPQVQKVRRMYQEAIQYYANENFWKEASPRTLPGPESITPTQSLLQKKYQYIFQARVKFSGEVSSRLMTVSYMSNRRITKGTAEVGVMAQLTLQWGNKYKQDIEFEEITLLGVKQSAWAV